MGEYALLLERHGLEVRSASLLDRRTKLDDGRAGLRNWLEMFRGEVFRGMDEGMKKEIIARVEDQLRSALFRDGAWYADYRRLRITASKV